MFASHDALRVEIERLEARAIDTRGLRAILDSLTASCEPLRSFFRPNASEKRVDLAAIGLREDALSLPVGALRPDARAIASRKCDTVADIVRQSDRFSANHIRVLADVLRALPQDVMLRDAERWDAIAARALERLSGRDGIIVRRWLGVTEAPARLRDIAQLLGITPARVHQVAQNAFRGWRLGWSSWVTARLEALVQRPRRIDLLGKSDAFFAVAPAQTKSFVRFVDALGGDVHARSERGIWILRSRRCASSASVFSTGSAWRS
jgi:hypothetical protein